MRGAGKLTHQARVFGMNLVERLPVPADEALFFLTERTVVAVVDEKRIIQDMLPANFQCAHAKVVFLAVAAAKILLVEIADLVEDGPLDIHAEGVPRRYFPIVTTR